MPACVVLTEAGGARPAERRDVMTIGRDAGNDIAPDDPRLPRRHPMPYRTQDGDFDLADEDDSNGSVVNGARVDLPTWLNDRDRVEIGSLRKSNTCVFDFRATHPCVA